LLCMPSTAGLILRPSPALETPSGDEEGTRQNGNQHRPFAHALPFRFHSSVSSAAMPQSRVASFVLYNTKITFQRSLNQCHLFQRVRLRNRGKRQ
jgi:hypothetical protein